MIRIRMQKRRLEKDGREDGEEKYDKNKDVEEGQKKKQKRRYRKRRKEKEKKKNINQKRIEEDISQILLLVMSRWSRGWAEDGQDGYYGNMVEYEQKIIQDCSSGI